MIPLSSHIRVLIFSPWSGLFVYFNRNLFYSVSASVTVDSVLLCPTLEQVNNTPLFVCPWDPSLYSPGLHYISVAQNVLAIVTHAGECWKFWWNLPNVDYSHRNPIFCWWQYCRPVSSNLAYFIWLQCCVLTFSFLFLRLLLLCMAFMWYLWFIQLYISWLFPLFSEYVTENGLAVIGKYLKESILC